MMEFHKKLETCWNNHDYNLFISLQQEI